MYLGEEYVNNPKLSDVTFLVEGGVSAIKIFCCYYFSLVVCNETDFDICTNLSFSFLQEEVFMLIEIV